MCIRDRGFPHIFLRVFMEQAAGIHGQGLPVSANVLLERQSCCLGADVPQGRIHRPRQIDRDKCEVAVNVPQLMPYPFPVIGGCAQNHRGNVIVEIRCV